MCVGEGTGGALCSNLEKKHMKEYITIIILGVCFSFIIDHAPYEYAPMRFTNTANKLGQAKVVRILRSIMLQTIIGPVLQF